MRSLYKKIERAVLWSTPMRRLVVPRYQYSFSPSQLSYINSVFVESHAVEGISLEVGCFVGATTVFLNANYTYGMPRRAYIAIDTFSGFVPDDVRFEKEVRGKSLKDINDETLFNVNSQKRFDYTMAIGGHGNVASRKMDVNEISQLTISDKIAFCLVDVDLYRPTLSALRYVIPNMQKGGILIVDDCLADSPFDGSLQALAEASRECGRDYHIMESKLGVMRF